jgi:hypothetical protein
MPSAEASDDTETVPLVRRLLVVVFGALAFCAAATAATGDPQYQLNPADQSWADSILVGSADLGADWKQAGGGGSIDGSSGGGGGDTACSTPDESDLIMTGGSASPDFIRSDGAWMSTAAVVWQTPDQAQADWDRNVQPGLLSCLASSLSTSSTKKVKIVVAGKKQLAFPAIAGGRSAAYRLSLILKGTVKVRKKTRKVAIRASFDFVAVGSGRATAMLWTFALNRQPVSDFNKQQWALLMAQRMTVDPSPPT